MKIIRNGSRQPNKGPEEYFTGNVRIDPLFEPESPARTLGVLVTFEEGARTAWHTHPLGQTIIITAGVGLVQRWGDAIEEVTAGDIVWFPPGEKHWHGASPTEAMSHIALVELQDGKSADWLEHVSDDQYLGR